MAESVKRKNEENSHIKTAKQQTPTCTLATTLKILRLPCATNQSKPLKVRAKAKMFLKIIRQVKDSIAMSPIPG